MVMRANSKSGELGGHLASYASAADLFEVGFNHFFRGNGEPLARHREGSDFLQPHSGAGVYARAFLEGRLTEETCPTSVSEVGWQRLVFLFLIPG